MAASFREMRKLLREPPGARAWPAGVGVAAFIPGQHAEAVHHLLTAAYKGGGGHVAPFSIWWEQLQNDEEYDPTLVFLARDAGGVLAGVAQCWTSAFIKDLAVSEEWRRRGVATALLHHTFNVFWTRGAPWVGLKVQVGNPFGAEQLYRKVGMTAVDIG